MFNNTKPNFPPIFRRQQSKRAAKQGKTVAILGKRQKFIIAVIVLSIGLFLSEYLFNRFGFFVSFFLGALTDILLFWTLQRDLKENFSPQVFVLPFLYSLSFEQFYFLAPARLITRIVITTLYAVGLYSLFLSENIFIVASIRTIALLNGARIVSFVITLVSYFFLTNIIFSLRTSIFLTSLILFFITFLFILQSIWTYTLDRDVKKNSIWIGILSMCLFELGVILWFWPATPTVLALFMTGSFYTLVGLSHVWLDKRLFKGILWEYIWVAIFSFFILMWFTQWQ